MVERLGSLKLNLSNKFRSAYSDHIWPLLPITQSFGTYNEVRTAEPKHRLLDPVVPWRTPSSIDDYKDINVEQVKRAVKSGDHVITIGGGLGVTSTVAAKQVGKSGKVTVYEGSTERVKTLEKTYELNKVSEVCDIRHAVVGSAFSVSGSFERAEIVQPKNLPECDILELDCEGSELGILENINIHPQTIIVEAHHKTNPQIYNNIIDLTEILEKRGYTVEISYGNWSDAVITATI